jgi:hypothetical protein
MSLRNTIFMNSTKHVHENCLLWSVETDMHHTDWPTKTLSMSTPFDLIVNLEMYMFFL